MQVYITQIIAAGIAAFGFGALFKLPPKRLPVIALGGMAGWFVYILATAVGGLSYFNGLFLGALFIAILSEVLARVLRTPTIVFIVPMLIPLVPGGDLFHMMTNLVTEQEEAFTESLHLVFAAAGAIALAIMVVSAVVSVITAVRRRSNKQR